MSELAQIVATVEIPELPYPGINPYRYSDRNVFSGRNTEAQALLRLIVMYRGVLLYAGSGIGKSSLVNAGLVSLALKEGYQPHRIRVQPRLGEEIVIERFVEDTGSAKRFLPSALIDDDHSERTSLSVRGFSKKLREVAASARLLLIFDQFEEWATLFEEAGAGKAFSEVRAAQENIGDAITAVLKDRQLPVKILISLREDYLAKLTPIFKQCPALPDQYLRLTPLKSSQICAVIRQPFDDHPGQYPHEIDSPLSKKIQEQFEARSSSGEVRLTELQIVCRSLFESGVPTKDLEEFFEQQHGVQGILEKYLEHALDSLGAEQREPAICLLSRLVTSAGTRNVIYEGDLLSLVEKEEGISRDLLRRTLNNLEENTKLIRRESRRDVYYYEISSEFLVGWIQQKSQAHDIIKEQKKLAQQRQAREKDRKRRQLLLALTVGLLVFAIVAIVAWRQEAIRAKEAREANSRRLAMFTSAIASPDPEVSLWLAFQAALQTLPKDSKLLPEIEDALRGALRKTESQYKLRGTISKLSDLAFSPDGARIATADDGEAIRIWNALNGSLELTLTGHTDSVNRLTFDSSGTRLATASDDQTIRVWDTSSGKSFKIDVPQEVWGLMFSSDGRYLAAVLANTKVKVWNAVTGQEREDYPESQVGQTFGLSFSTDWDFGKPHRLAHDRLGNIVYQDNGLDSAIADRAFSPDGKYFATAKNDGTVRVRDASSGKELYNTATLKGEKKSSIRKICFSPDGGAMAVGREDGTVEILGDTRYHFEGLNSPRAAVDAFAFSRDGSGLAISSQDGTVTLWKASPTLQHIEGLSSELTLSRDGSRLAAIEGEETRRIVRVWDTSSAIPFPIKVDVTLPAAEPASANHGAIRPGFRQEQPRLRHVVLSPNGSRLAAVSETNGEIMVYEVDSGISAGKPIPAEDLYSFALSQDGQKLLSVNSDGTVKLWDVSSGKLTSTWTQSRNSSSLSFVAFADDLRHVALVNRDGGVTVLSSLGQRSVLEKAEQAPNLPVRFSPNGKLLATISKQHKVKLWDVFSAKELPDPSIDAEEASELIFNPMDGDRLATVIFNPDGTSTVAIWSITSGRIQQKLTVDTMARFLWPTFAFANDGKHLIAVNRYGMVQSLVLDDRTLIRLAKDRLGGRPMTYTDCKQYTVLSDGCDAAKLVEEGINLVKEVNFAAAEVKFEKSRSLDSKYEAEARRLAAESSIEQGKDSAEDADVDLNAVAASFAKAKRLDPKITFDAEVEARHWLAKNWLRHARRGLQPQSPGSLQSESIQAALSSYDKALEIDPNIKLRPNDWNAICWFGSLHGNAQAALKACENAVALDPENSEYRDSRGAARALTGDYSGAIQDFQAFIQSPHVSTNIETRKLERRGWLTALRAGHNPLTPEVLRKLAKE
jgi:WD40 repeat protein